MAATAAWKQDVTIDDREQTLAWYRSSAQAQRGFCNRCGSSIFWRPEDADTITILAGTLDGDAGLQTAAEIYAGDKGDYYELADTGVPVYAQSGHDVFLPPRNVEKAK